MDKRMYRFWLLFILCAAVVVGVVYYHNVWEGESKAHQGTLVWDGGSKTHQGTLI